MKWWLKALILSGVWVAICSGAVFFIPPANDNPALDAKLSEILGEICGAGLVAIWAILFARWKLKDE